MTPSQVGHLTPAEIYEMTDGIDWVNDRAWELALFARHPDPKVAFDIFEYNYPHFRADRVVEIIHADPGDDRSPRPKRFAG